LTIDCCMSIENENDMKYRNQNLVCGIRYELDIIHNMKISMTCALSVFSHCALHTCMRCMTKLEMCRETNQ
jgi:hypothetical protein